MNTSPDNSQNNNNSISDFESPESGRTGRISNPYASSYNEENEEIERREAALRRRTVYEPEPMRRRVRKKAPSFKFNWGFLVFTLIVAAVVVFSLVQIASRPPKDPATPDTPDAPPITIGEPTDNETNSPADEPPVNPAQSGKDKDIIPEYDFFEITMDENELDDGDLILVNYAYEYKDADKVDTVNLYNKKTSSFKVAGSGIELSKIAFNALEDMVDGLRDATGCSDMIVNSGYRTIQDQIDIYDYYLDAKGEEYAKAYVANPGQSEHHTGLACDLSFYLDEGYSEPIGEHSHGAWVSTHCTDYGFVIRYPAEKVEYTKIAYEAWHFRYVGVVHAKAMTALGYCLEEYIEHIANYTLEDKLLFISDEGSVKDVTLSSLPTSGGSLVYFAPAARSGETTVKILGEKGDDYEISGTNTGGYIVTIPLK